MAIQSPDRGYSVWELGFALVAIGSAGEVTVLGPLLVLRTWRRLAANQPVAWEAIILFALAAGAVADATLSAHFSNGQPLVWAWIWSGLWWLLITGVVYWPLIGAPASEFLARNTNLLFYCLWALSVGTGVAIASRKWIKSREGMTVAMALVSALVVPVLTWFVRPGAADFFAHKVLAADLAYERYAFQIAPALLVMWTVLLARSASIRASTFVRSVPYVFLLANIIHSLLAAPHITPFDGDWDSRAAEFEAVVRGRSPESRVEIPIAPRKYGFVLRYPAD